MISMTKNYLEELRFPISKEEKQVLAKMYGDLSVCYFLFLSINARS